MAEAEFKKAKQRRTTVKGTLTRANTFLGSEKANTVSLAQLRQRKTKIEETWDTFDEAQTIIDIAMEGEVVEDERMSFESAYFDVVSRFDQLIATRARNEERAPTGQNEHENNRDREANNTNNNLRLPKIELPTFSGGYEQWYPFYDTFNSLIHNVEFIPNIQKFHYLRSSLKGEAAEVIQSLEVSADNYPEAWEMLRQRYDNKRLIIQKHIKAIFDLPVISKENFSSLRLLLDGVLKHKRALGALGRSTDHWDDLLVHLITSKLDVITNREWENSLTGPEIPDLKMLTGFLEHRCHTLEIIHKRTAMLNPPITNKQRQLKPTSSNVATQNSKCPICKGEHFVYMCETLLKMAAPDRAKAIRDCKLCLNCMRSNSHQAKDCPSRGCKNCGKRHNTLLHFTSSSNAQGDSRKNDKPVEPVSHVSAVTHALHDHDGSQVWLSTAVIQVLDVDGKAHSCRALLDPGSQSNLITEALAKKLRLPLHATNVPIVGINQLTSFAQDIVKVSIISRHYSFQRDTDCLVLKRITDKLPSTSFQKSQMNLPQNLRLADASFHTPGNIDVLIGATVFWESLCVGQIKATADHPVLQKTLFGWVLGGSSQEMTQSRAPTFCNLITNQQLDTRLTRFWESERCPELVSLTNDEKHCDHHFAQTYRRDNDGRFVVQLPFKEDMIEQLGESKNTALRRFYALERKLKRNSELRDRYIEFLDEYQRLGHMELIEQQDSPPTGYYIPHHPVVKEASVTTKLRVVFDASCKTSTGISLNDALMVGPTLQQDLLDIILRFRAWQYVMTSDVEKMYRQVRVDKSQTQYQRILWRANPDEEVKTFELKTVTYGTASASFLAIRALQEAARANDLDRAITIRNEVIAALAKAGFKLRKWASNTEELLKNLPDSVSPDPVLTLDKNEHSSTLGLQWYSALDTLQYEVKQPIPEKSVTKRIILSSIARIFDPLGLLGPVIITAKILIQRLWLLKIDWDETVPLDIETKWRAYEAQLGVLNALRIPRRAIEHSQLSLIEMHGFCDASMEAYGAVVYVKTTSMDGQREIRLLCAKSRVAPAKTITLPRLELCAALLLEQVIHRITQAIGIKFDGIYYWSDSMITLVGQIQELTDSSSWKHVSTKENPADAISRGISPTQLTQSGLWWNGPQWLNAETTDYCASSSVTPTIEELPAARKTVLIATNAQHEWSIFYTISTLTKLIRSMAYILRFIDNTKTAKPDRRVGPLSAQELNLAEIRLVKIIQGYTYLPELKALQKNEPLARSSKLLGLSPFLDSAGVIRVGGRLSHSKLPYSTKHPIVLPSKHRFTRMVIVYEHQRLLHSGPQSTLASLRQRFWPIPGRSAVRQVTRSCVKCFRNAPVARQAIMGDLPAPRVSPARPFISN